MAGERLTTEDKGEIKFDRDGDGDGDDDVAVTARSSVNSLYIRAACRSTNVSVVRRSLLCAITSERSSNKHCAKYKEEYAASTNEEAIASCGLSFIPSW